MQGEGLGWRIILQYEGGGVLGIFQRKRWGGVVTWRLS